MNTIKFFIFCALFSLVSACSQTPESTSKAGTLKKAQVVVTKKALVVAIKRVIIIGEKSNAGRTVGSVTGSLLGSSVTVAGSLLGSVVGGAIGAQADKVASKKPGLEITLELEEDGQKVVVTQLQSKADIRVGKRVTIVVRDNVAEVVPY